VPEARWFGRENRQDDDDQGDGLSGGMTGDGPRRGRRQEPRPAGRWPYGRGEPPPGGPAPLPLGRWSRAVTRQPVPAPRGKQRL